TLDVEDASVFSGFVDGMGVTTPFAIRVENEDMFVTSVDLMNNQLTVTRSGTAAAAHSDTATVFELMTTALDADIDDVVTTFTVTNVRGVETAQIVRIDNEDMLVTGVNPGTNELTVERGFNSTANVPHVAAGSTVFRIQTTAPINFDATDVEIEAALEALSAIDDVTVTGGQINSLDVDSFMVGSVEFGGRLIRKNIQPLTADILQEDSNRFQRISLDPDFSGTGTFVLTFNGEVTGPLNSNASANAVQTELESLMAFTAGDIDVTGGPLGTSDILVEFLNTAGMEVASLMPVSSMTNNERQELTLTGSPNSGTFRLRFLGQTTNAINFDATAADVQVELEALSSIGVGNVTVSGFVGLPNGTLTIAFTGNLADTNVPEITVTNDFLIPFSADPEITTIEDGNLGVIATDITGLVGTEIQEISISNDFSGNGTYTLTFDDTGTPSGSFGRRTTDPIPFDSPSVLSRNESQSLLVTATGGAFSLSFVNEYGAVTNLQNGVDDMAMTLDVEDASVFSGLTTPFAIRVGSEDMLVTTVDVMNDQLTVTRAQGSTIAAAHSDTATVFELMTTVLAADIDETDQTISVLNARGIGSAPFIRIDGEELEVISVDVAMNTVDVVRGSHGTVPAVHLAAGSTVSRIQTTAPINFDATAADIETALELLPAIDNVTATGGPVNLAAVDVEFAGALARKNVQPLTANTVGEGELIQIEIAPVFTGTGTFVLEVDGETTTPLSPASTVIDIQAALEALPGVGIGNVVVAGTDLPGGPVQVQFVGQKSGSDININALEIERQQLSLSPGTVAGTFTLDFDGQVTIPIPFNASVSLVQSELEALSNLGGGNVTVSGTSLPGGVLLIDFVGVLAGTNVAQIVADDALLGGTVNLTTVREPLENNERQELVIAGSPTGGTFTLTLDGNTTGPIPHNADSTVIRAALQSLIGVGTDEVQTFSIDPTFSGSGTFTLTFGAETTVPLPHDATAVQIQTALENLPNIGALNVTVTGTNLVTGNLQVAFVNLLGGQDVSDITADSSGLTNNEHQQVAITGTPTGGTFTLSFDPDGAGMLAPETTIPLAHNADVATVLAALRSLTSLGTDEVQSITIDPTFTGSGTFALTFDGDMTGAIPHSATAAQIDAALETLPSINLGDMASDNVTVAGTNLVTGDIQVTFVNQLGGRDVSDITVDSTGLTNNEHQQVAITGGPTGGTFTLSFDPDGPGAMAAETTNPIAHNADAATVQAALQSLASLGGNEVQTVSIDPTFTGTGTFTLTFGAETTVPLLHDAGAAQIQTALENLANIGAGNVTVTGTSLVAGDLQVTFVNLLGGRDVSDITVDSSGLTNNEHQQVAITGTPTGGTFTLSYDPDGAGAMAVETTIPLAHDADAATVLAALQSLTSLGTDEVQSLTIDPTFTGSGTFTLTFDGQTTGPIQHNATATQIDTALEALSSINLGAMGSDNVSVTGTNLVTGDIQVTFVNQLGGRDVSDITVDSTGLTNNERQQVAITGNPNAGDFTLSFEGKETAAIPFNATAVQVQTALLAVTSIDEIQQIQLGNSFTAGSFVLEFDGQTTAPIAFNATAGEIDTALEGLSSIGAGNVIVTGGGLPGTPVSVQFTNALGGQDVAPLGVLNVNEIQEVSLTNATGGTFTLTFDPDGAGPQASQTTDPISFDASNAAVQDELDDLAGIGAADVTVTGGALPGSPVTIEFVGALAAKNIAELEIDDSGLFGTGAVGSVTTIQETLQNNERQQVALTGSPTGGNFTLTFDSQTTGAIAHDADAAAVERAIQALTSVPGANEVQTITIDPTFNGTGQFTLTFAGQTTAALSHNAPATGMGSVQAALESLPNIDPGDVSVTGSLPGTIEVTFNGNLAEVDVPDLIVSANEIQTLTLANATGGTFTLTFDEQTTNAIPFNATADNIRSFLENLSNIGTGDVTTTGGDLPGTPVAIEFTGALAGIDVAEIVTDPSLLTGSTPTATVMTTQLPLANNEVQQLEITGNPTGGTFTLSLDTETTAAIDFDADVNTVRSALQSLSNIGTDEVQSIVIDPTFTGTGTLDLTFGMDTASAIPHNATTAQIDMALEALSSINLGAMGSDNVTVTGTSFADGDIQVKFTNQLGGRDVSLMTVGSNLMNNERQQLTITGGPTSGDFTLTFGGQMTSALSHNATAAEIDAALEGLSTINLGSGSSDNVSVTGSLPGTIVVTFIGNLAEEDVPDLIVSANEIQTLTLGNATGGTFTLTFDGQTTNAIPFNATADNIRSFL
ncbi:MAG: hypothetical protein VB858_02330, partial [Planctomycetaceae bacterium]